MRLTLSSETMRENIHSARATDFFKKFLNLRILRAQLTAQVPLSRAPLYVR